MRARNDKGNDASQSLGLLPDLSAVNLYVHIQVDPSARIPFSPTISEQVMKQQI